MSLLIFYSITCVKEKASKILRQFDLNVESSFGDNDKNSIRARENHRKMGATAKHGGLQEEISVFFNFFMSSEYHPLVLLLQSTCTCKRLAHQICEF